MTNKKELAFWEVVRDAKDGDIFDPVGCREHSSSLICKGGTLFILHEDGKLGDYAGCYSWRRKMKYVLREPQWEDCTEQEAIQGLKDNTHKAKTDLYGEVKLYENNFIVRDREDYENNDPILYKIDMKWQRRLK